MKDLSTIIALDLKQAKLDEDTKTLFAKCEEKIGFVPNVLAAYSHDLEKLKAFSAMYNNLMLAPSGLSKIEREMIAVVVSSSNKCVYCLTAHGATLRELTKDPILADTLIYNYRAATLTDKQRAMCDFALLMTESPQAIEEEDRDMLRDSEWEEKDIWDIAATAAFYNMSNRMASALDMQPNKEYHSKGR